MREVVYLKNIIQNIRVYFVYIRGHTCNSSTYIKISKKK